MRQPAGDGPSAHLGLGQEGQRRQGAEQRDIGPGHMVADPEHRLLGLAADQADAEWQRTGQAGEEPAGQALPGGHQVAPVQTFQQTDPDRQQETQADHGEQTGDTPVETCGLQHGPPQTAALKWRA
ncbi:hypothetical protein D3C72_2027260 [compost metagenome]